MKRKIIRIDNELCTGCGLCVPDCPEGAIQIIDGKARLVSDLFCDGLGACIGTCPENAISIEEREAEPYDEEKVMQNIIPQGENVIRAHLEHLAGHGEHGLHRKAVEILKRNNISIDTTVKHVHSHACPGSAIRDMRKSMPAPARTVSLPGVSRLQQWPVQLKLLNPDAPYFDDADILIAADCVPFAYAGFHEEMLKGKIVIVFCPKLDTDIEGYVDKLAAIFSRHSIKSVTAARMEVPCCGGATAITEEALKRSRKNIPFRERVISIAGDLKS